MSVVRHSFRSILGVVAVLVLTGCAATQPLSAREKAVDRCAGGSQRCVSQCLYSIDGFTRSACEAQCRARVLECEAEFDGADQSVKEN